MENLEQKLIEEIAKQNVSISAECAQALIERFGVKKIEEMDDDFVQICLSCLQIKEVDQTEQQQQEDTSNYPAPARQHLSNLATAIEQKAEIEAARIAELYSQVPKRVKDLVLKDIQEELASQPKDQTLINLKHVVDFSVVLSVDNHSSRQFVHQVFVGILVLITLLLFGGIYESANSSNGKPDNTTTVNVQGK